MPAYPLTGSVSDVSVQRILVRQGVSRGLASLLLADLKESIGHFEKHPIMVAMTKEESGASATFETFRAPTSMRMTDTETEVIGKLSSIFE